MAKKLNEYADDYGAPETDFPDGKYLDEGVGIPGTSIKADGKNQIYYFFSKLMSSVSLSFNGTLDNFTSSQFFTALTTRINNLIGVVTDQILKTTSSVTFTSVNTGQGANELYGMDQDVKSTDDVEFVNETLKKLFVETIFVETINKKNPDVFSLEGSGLSISGIGSLALSSLSSTDVAFIDNNLKELRTYRFNGSTWSLVGSGLSIAGIGTPALTALSSTDVAFIDSTLEELRTYKLSFTDFPPSPAFS